MAISDRITAITNHLTDDWNSIDRLGLHTNILPKEYTQVDYIQSSGTQYIDTGFKPNQDTRVYTKTYFNVSATASHLFGAREGSNTKLYSFSSWNNLYETKYYNGTLTIETQTQPMIIDKNKNITTIGNIVKENDYITFSTPVNMYIFATNDNGSIFGETGTKRIYWFKLYDNGTIVRDFIPCYRNSDNEVGLYDIVNDVFYTNQGTGTFTYGEIQEQHIDKNTKNIKEPLDLFYNEVSDKTDLSVNGIVGRTSQETTTGKNLFNPNNNVWGKYNVWEHITGNYTNAFTNTFDVIGGQVCSISFKCNVSIRFSYQFLDDEDNYLSGIYRTAGTLEYEYENISIPQNATKVIICQLDGSQTDDIKIQFEYNNTCTTWEQYTGGQPSPNPSYSQPINNLSGDVAYKVSGKNLLDENYYNNSSLYAAAGLYYAFVELPDTFKTKFYVNMSVKGTNQNLVFGFIDTTSGTFVDGIRVLNNGTLNSNVECDFTNSEHVYIGIGNGSNIDKNTDIARIFDNYNIMVSTTSGEQYEPYIEPQTFNIPLKSKNYIDTKNITDTIEGLTITRQPNGQILVNGTNSSTGYLLAVDFSGDIPSENYVLSIKDQDGNGYASEFYYRYGSTQNHEYKNINDKQISFTNKVTRVQTYIYVPAKTYNNTLISIQLEQGSASSPYEPYYDIELCKIDTYEDKIYSSDGRFYLSKNIGKVLLNGSESWNTGSTSTDYGYFFTSLIDNIAVNSYTSKKSYCDRFQWVYDITVSSANGNVYAITNASSYKLRISIAKSLLSSVDVNGFKSWLSNNNTEIAFPLITPTTTEITQENYPSLYNALKQIQDYLTAYKINKEFILGYSSPEIEY